ncbi:MAG TPA: exosortase H [Gammaproteobacteria bacterium]|nr:exosortase H [Gammaproteobacteria bacterium]
MNKLIFISVLLILFTLELFDPVQRYFIQPFTQHLATITASILHLFDKDVFSSGIILRSISNGSAVSIQPGCNGIEAVICLVAAIVAYYATWKEKLLGLILGFFAIQSLNIVRIISLFYLLQWNKSWFEWAHLYAWQALIFLDVLIVFVVWIRWVSTRNSKNIEPSTAHG